MGIISVTERQIRKLSPNDSQNNNALSNTVARTLIFLRSDVLALVMTTD
jgi:hypothetical protein